MICPLYLIVATVCGVGVLACLIYGLCEAAKEADEQILEQVKAEHREACERQCSAQVDDFFVAVDEIRAECLEPELGSVEWLEDLYWRGPEKVR